ncbi:MAG: hypothetical protein K2H53_00285 [Clostridia bacterium]|nr:hypothetical protein [Clostridia bacterium]
MVGEDIVYRLRNKLYKYVQYANINFHDRTPSGTLFVRITSDVEDITTAFKDVVTTLVKDIVMIIAFAWMMITLDSKLSLICFVIIPLVVLTSFVITKISKKVQEASKKAKTRLNIFLSESIYGVKLIKIFNRQYEKNKECESYCNAFYKSRIPTAYVEGFLVAFMDIFKNLGVSIIVWACINHFFGISLDVRNNLRFHYISKGNFRPNRKNCRKF